MCSVSRPVMSDSMGPCGLQPLSTEFSRQNPGVGSRSLLQRIFPTQGLNLGLPHYRQMLYHLSYQGSPESVIHIHISTLFQIIFPYRSLQSIEQSSLCYTLGPIQLFSLYTVLSICQSQSPNLSLPLFHPQVTISLFSIIHNTSSVLQISLSVPFLKILHISTIIFVCLCLTYFTQYDNLQVHSCCYRWHYFALFYD